MLEDLWRAVRGKVSPVPAPDYLNIRLPDHDDASDVPEAMDVPGFEPEPISGFSCIIQYRDSRGRDSERRITCQRLDQAAAQSYLYAYCHERGAIRQFKVDRIVAIADIHTGEVLDPPLRFFARFRIDREQQAQLGWGLSVRKRADMVAALNVLVFMGRCDKEWHPLEREALESFVESYWLRAEVEGDPPIDDIIAHAERLSPDAETFYVSLIRCGEHPVISKIIRRHIQSVVDADGELRIEEQYWGRAVDEFFAGSAN